LGFLTRHYFFHQVEFLCERGADVNRGLRSSSLHYAACFGRPQIVKVTMSVNISSRSVLICLLLLTLVTG